MPHNDNEEPQTAKCSDITVDPWLHKAGDATVPDDAEFVCVYWLLEEVARHTNGGQTG